MCDLVCCQVLDQEFARVFGRRVPVRPMYSFTRQEKLDVQQLYEIFNKHMKATLHATDRRVRRRGASLAAVQPVSDQRSTSVADADQTKPRSLSVATGRESLTQHSRTSSFGLTRNSSQHSGSESATGELAIIGLALEELAGDDNYFFEKLAATQMFDEHSASKLKRTSTRSMRTSTSPKHAKRLSAALKGSAEFTDAQLQADRTTTSQQADTLEFSASLDLKSTIRSGVSEESAVFPHLEQPKPRKKSERTSSSRPVQHRSSTSDAERLRRLSADLLREGIEPMLLNTEHIAPADLYRREK